MTVPVQDPITSYTGNGVATQFAVPFRILDAADLKVLFNSVLVNSYTITGLGDDEGTVTFNTAPPVGAQIVIYRQVALERLTDYQFNGDLRAVTVNADFDRIWMALQDVADTSSRAIHFPVEEYGTDGTLPVALTRASNMLGFDSLGQIAMLPIPPSVGAGDLKNESWTNGVDYTAGSSLTLTLTRPYGSKANLGTVVMQGIAQDPASYSLSGSTLTFNAPIPVGVDRVWCVGGTTISLNQPAASSVGDNELQWGDLVQRTFTSISTLRANADFRYSVVHVNGYYSPGDGAGGDFYLDVADTTTVDNGGSVIVDSRGGRWKRTKQNWTPEEFGARGDDSTDNLAALNKLIAALPSNRMLIKFGPGVFRFSAPLAYTFPSANPSSISIFGAGPDLTMLKFMKVDNPGIAISMPGAFNSVHIRDMTVASGVSKGSQGILLTQTQVTNVNPANTAFSDITNVNFRGSDGYIQTFGWAVDCYCYCVSFVNWTNCKFAGPYISAGVQLEATATNIGVVYNFVGCDFSGVFTGLSYGQYIQGVTVVSCNFGCQHGILCPPAVNGGDQLAVFSSQFNCAQTGIFLQSPVEASMIQGNFFLINNNAAGIRIQNSAGMIITGNYFSPASLPATAQIGIRFESYLSQASVVSCNVFQQITSALLLDATSQHVNVQSNNYLNNGSNVTNSGTNNTIGGGSQ